MGSAGDFGPGGEREPFLVNVSREDFGAGSSQPLDTSVGQYCVKRLGKLPGPVADPEPEARDRAGRGIVPEAPTDGPPRRSTTGPRSRPPVQPPGPGRRRGRGQRGVEQVGEVLPKRAALHSAVVEPRVHEPAGEHVV
jgi:hypothetical protein